ncbi:MAG: YciI family protein [Actinocatenispora sp.]
MQYLVTGVDAPSFGTEEDLDDAHQDYMDGWADRLIARGPTLSADGERHTGSVHVVELPDLAAARRFAHDEPYATAGWYSTVEVGPIVPCLDGTMWHRPAPAGSGIAAAVTSSCTGHDAADLARTLRQHLGDVAGWIYVGVRCDEAGSATGVLALMDARPVDAPAQLATVLHRAGVAAASVEASRWQRGGRFAG